MRKLPAMIAGAGLLLVIAAPAVVGDTNRDFKASLNGYLETPSVSTTARGCVLAADPRREHHLSPDVPRPDHADAVRAHPLRAS